MRDAPGRQGGYSVDWWEVGRLWLAVVGIIGIATTVASVVISDIPGSSSMALALILGAAALGLVGSAWVSRIPDAENWLAPDCQGRLVLRLTHGDILDSCPDRTSTVITMNRSFGLTTPDVLDTSLINQLATSLGGRQHLAERFPGCFDLEHEVPSGSLRELTLDGRRYLLVAATTVRKPEGSVTALPLQDVMLSLVAIWQWMDQKGRDVRMPILGSGWSGSTLGHEVLLTLIAVSLLSHQHERAQPAHMTTVEVVSRRQDRRTRTVKSIRGVLRDLGYSRSRR